MKRLTRFILLTLGYLLAVIRVAGRRLPKLSLPARNSRRRIGMVSATGLALFGLVVAGNLLSPPANAVTIRSSTGSDACTVEVGNASNAYVTKNGDYCVVTITSNTTVTFPSYIGQIGIIVVGGGAGGFADGGSGGSGGEVRVSSAQNVTAGGTATVSIGAGGSAGVWGGSAPGTGGASSVSGAGLSYTANSGLIGSGWGNGTWHYGGSGGSGGTGYTGGSAGGGPSAICDPYRNGGSGGAGPQVSINGFGSTYFSGGGGGGTGANTYNSNSYSGLGAAGGAGGGGSGANLRFATDDSTWVNGTSAGHNGTYYGAGGGGGGACDSYASGQGNGVYQRTAGGAGYQGVVIMSWMENRLAVSQAPDGCLYNVAEACLQEAKIQITNASLVPWANPGVTVTIVSTSVGTLGGTLTAVTDSSGVATFSSFWLTGTTVGSTPTLTF
jgi:hypothetical protein